MKVDGGEETYWSSQKNYFEGSQAIEPVIRLK